MMRKIILVAFLTFITSSSFVHAQPVITEQQLEEKIKADRILHMYATDAGITGVELNQFGAPSTEFIVPGDYEDIPENLKSLANEHNVQIMPSQVSGKISVVKFAVSIILYVAIPLGMLILLFIINRKLTLLIKLVKKDDK